MNLSKEQDLKDKDVQNQLMSNHGIKIKARSTCSSLDQAHDELRDAYLNFKELSNKCRIDLKDESLVQMPLEVETDEMTNKEGKKEQLRLKKDEQSDMINKKEANQVKEEATNFFKPRRKVFYFKPESVLMANPDIQKNYREKLLEQIQAVPKLQRPMLLWEELQESRILSVADRSQPNEVRKTLAAFFKRRQYQLRHKRYKMMLRWAHKASRTRDIDHLAQQATYRLAKMQLEHDLAVQRYQRLSVDDDYTFAQLTPEERPSSKSRKSEGTLYLEKKDMPPQSAIRADDIEVFTRHTTYSTKINKLVNKFMSRLKWMALCQKFHIFDGAVNEYFLLRNQSIEQQEAELSQAEAMARTNSLISKQAEEEIQLMKAKTHITTYKKTMYTNRIKILSACRPDYEVAPNFISSIPEIKVGILKLAGPLGLAADLTQDNGFSFAYQLSLIFPPHFQKQIIMSCFTVYDAFASEYSGSSVMNQKRNLSSSIKMDPNVFKDVSTANGLIPTEDTLAEEVLKHNLKVIRLKGSPWVECIVCQPKQESWEMAQSALIYSGSNPIDTLLQGSLDFLDVNDLASVNLVIQEASQIYLEILSQQHIAQEQSQQSKISESLEISSKQGTSSHISNPTDSEQKRNVRKETIYQTVSAKNMQESLNNLYFQMNNALIGKAVQLSGSEIAMKTQAGKPKVNSIFSLPLHLIQSFNTLRYMRSRDYKIKILYTLNYFRAIQKRLMLDLQEFGTRERVLGDVGNPVQPPSEIDQYSSDTLNYAKLGNTTLNGPELKSFEKIELLSKEKIDNINQQTLGMGFSLVDLKKITSRGKFYQKHLSTCPSLPKSHAAYGEPSEIEHQHAEDSYNEQGYNIVKSSLKLLGRIDKIEINNSTQEVYVKDDFGIYIMYECSLTDMRMLEEEILRIGSFYIAKHEELYDSQIEQVIHTKDRQQVLCELLQAELDFQFQKVKLTELYMKCYEHIIDPLEQQQLIQIIVDTMARRPRLNLDSLYFKDSYHAESRTITNQIELLDTIIQNQMNLEKMENTNIHESLNLSYTLAKKKHKDGWSFADADSYLSDLIERCLNQKTEQSLKTSESMAKTLMKKSETIATQQSVLESNNKKTYEDPTFEMRNMRYCDQELDPDAFTKLLGLPKITLEQLFDISKENDEFILEVMGEQSHFTKLLEGYPDLMSQKHSGKSITINTSESLNSVIDITQLTRNEVRAQLMSILDFYTDSMSFIVKLVSSLQNCYTELESVLKPHDSIMKTVIESNMYRAALTLYRQTTACLLGSETEIEGHQYIEDESILGSSDKMHFYMKEMNSELTGCKMASLNPFLVSKLDVSSIKLYSYPKSLNKKDNPYLHRKIDHDLSEGKTACIDIALTLFQDMRLFEKQVLRRFINETSSESQKAGGLKIQTPSMLQLQCNTIELMRMRQELMMCISECKMLEGTLVRQAKLCNLSTVKASHQDYLVFEHGQLDPDQLNFIDHGPASMLNINLAISELDPVMKSNINFRSSDAFKMLITNSGLEEFRLLLHYQIMHKQCLIVAVRTNQSIIDVVEKGLTEIELVKQGMALPNMVIPLGQLFSKTSEGIDPSGVNRVKTLLNSNLSSVMALCMQSPTQWKGPARGNLNKLYTACANHCDKQFTRPEVKLRVLRSYKVSLFNEYCNSVLEEVYAASMKYNVLAQFQKVRELNNYFQFSTDGQSSNEPVYSQLFQLETNDLLEMATDTYSYKRFLAQTKKHSKLIALDPKNKEQLDVLVLPSSFNVMQWDPWPFSQDAQKKIRQSQLKNFTFDILDNNLEGPNLYDQILPSLYCLTSRKEKSKLPRRQLLDFSQTRMMQMYQYYWLLETIIELELSVVKVGLSSDQVIELEHCMQKGIPYFYGGLENVPTGEDSSSNVAMPDFLSIVNSGKAVQDFSLTATGKKLLESQQHSQNQSSLKILNQLYRRKKLKKDITEELMTVASRVKNLLQEARSHADKTFVKIKEPEERSRMMSFHCDFLKAYQETKVLAIVSTFQKIADKRLSTGDFSNGSTIMKSLAALTRRDHIQVRKSEGNFHLNSAIIHSNKLSIEPSAILYQFGDLSEQINFQKCIHPVLSDRALEPSEIQLLENIYLNNKVEVPHVFGNIFHFESFESDLLTESNLRDIQSRQQFAGSCMHSEPSLLKGMNNILLHLTPSLKTVLNSHLKTIDNQLRDVISLVFREKIYDTQTMLDYGQLIQAKRYFTEEIEAFQLKQAAICIATNCSPLQVYSNPKLIKVFNDWFKRDIYWKVDHEKTKLLEANDSKHKVANTREQLMKRQEELELEILKLKHTNDRKVTDVEIEKANKQHADLLIVEMKEHQRSILTDELLSYRALVSVLRVEIERHFIVAGIRTLDNETLALANCLKNESREIDAHIHPFQQYAVTLYDQVDMNSHLDAINKLAHIQSFITRLKNRGTEVETLTSGPGYVFTIKDINDCVASLAKGLIKYAELELRSRCEQASKKDEWYQELLYCKDQQVLYLEQRLHSQNLVIDKLVNARMYQKGNQIVYELDQANRTLYLMKQNINLFEDKVRKDMEIQFINKLKQREMLLLKEMTKFREFKTDIVSTVNAQYSRDSEQIQKHIKDRANCFRNLEQLSPNQVKKLQQKQTRQMTTQKQNQQNKGKRLSLLKSVQNQVQNNQEEFEFDDTKPYDFPEHTKEGFLLSEKEAREELEFLYEKFRAFRAFTRLKEATAQSKFQDKMADLKIKMSSNSMLWEQMAEAEKREHVLRQELLISQQTLSNCEKIIEKQKDTIKALETEKVRLLNFKENKGKRLDELEQKVAQYQIYEKVSVERLVQVLYKQRSELDSLRSGADQSSHKMSLYSKRKHDELQTAHEKFLREQAVKSKAVRQLEEMRATMEVELSDPASGAYWKDKCTVAYKLCLDMKEESEQATQKCEELASLAVALMHQLNDLHSSSLLPSSQTPALPKVPPGFALPRLAGAAAPDSVLESPEGPTAASQFKDSSKLVDSKGLSVHGQRRGKSLLHLRNGTEGMLARLEQDPDFEASFAVKVVGTGRRDHAAGSRSNLPNQQTESLKGVKSAEAKKNHALFNSQLASHKTPVRPKVNDLNFASQSLFKRAPAELPGPVLELALLAKKHPATLRPAGRSLKGEFYNMKNAMGMQALYESKRAEQQILSVPLEVEEVLHHQTGHERVNRSHPDQVSLEQTENQTPFNFKDAEQQISLKGDVSGQLTFQSNENRPDQTLLIESKNFNRF